LADEFILADQPPSVRVRHHFERTSGALAMIDDLGEPGGCLQSQVLQGGRTLCWRNNIASV